MRWKWKFVTVTEFSTINGNQAGKRACQFLPMQFCSLVVRYSRCFYLGHKMAWRHLMMSFSIDYCCSNTESVIKLSVLPLHFIHIRHIPLLIQHFCWFGFCPFIFFVPTILFIHSFILFYVHFFSVYITCVVHRIRHSHFSEIPIFIYFLFSPNLCELVFL